jgi:hypothetical protein
VNARRYKVRVDPDGGVHLPDVDLAPGTEVEVILFASLDNFEAVAQDSLASLNSSLAEPVLARFWDTSEEDRAWRDI